MKSVKEIKEMRKNWLEKGGWGLGIEYLFDIARGITEHLTAQQLAIPRAFGPLINPDDERRGMIAALRWVRTPMQAGVPSRFLVGDVDNAITRLENGGDL